MDGAPSTSPAEPEPPSSHAADTGGRRVPAGERRRRAGGGACRPTRRRPVVGEEEVVRGGGNTGTCLLVPGVKLWIFFDAPLLPGVPALARLCPTPRSCRAFGFTGPISRIIIHNCRR
jgi:hypothetical protein